MDEDKRRILLIKQRIGLGHFPSTIVHEAGLIFEGNRGDWADLKRAEETYIAQIPLKRGTHGNLEVGRAVLAEALGGQSIATLLELTAILLDDAGAAESILSELARRVEAYHTAERPSPTP